MFSTSRGIAFVLAVSIALLLVAFLSLIDEVGSVVLLATGALSFSISYLIIHLSLEFLVFKEISNIYNVLEKIQRKDLSFKGVKKIKTSLPPLKSIQTNINEYAAAKNREIETLQKNETFRKEFIADISHELKTPIFAAQGYIHTLLDGAVEDHSVRGKFLKRAAKSLNNLENLVQDLITINQIESGFIRFHPIHFDLRETLLEVIEQLEGKAHKRGIRIHFQHVPEESYFTHADREKIFRVLQNLISNAIKYNKEKGEVTIQLKSHKNHLSVKIKDQGMGIHPEDLKRIFERFYRVEKSRSREKGGTGLGLAIVKHILEGHKSTISVSSIVGKGSVFSFDLPIGIGPVGLEKKT
ncbi:sensor histidine kinase [Cyclobacterium xiamenense]|jgi:two-component system phosphate regulon sensor histidine kinase PhoR|uniref:sensor histidine kinase n=1 Tax=Cyclobacterium xiamenense TaxID=1297121 RepID=UPI0035CF9790